MKTAVVNRTDYYRAAGIKDDGDFCGWIVIPEDDRKRLGLREIDSRNIPKESLERARKKLQNG